MGIILQTKQDDKWLKTETEPLRDKAIKIKKKLEVSRERIAQSKKNIQG